MAYDELLAMRMRDAMGDLQGVIEKRMMGGVCFMLRGNMVCGADRTRDGTRRFMFRLGKGNPAIATLRGGEVMMMGSRPMHGFYFVDEAQCTDADFHAWMEAALDHAERLPPKSSGPRQPADR